MRTTLSLLLAVIFNVPGAVVAEVNQLRCSVTLQDTQMVLKPRSTTGQEFSTFTLDLSIDKENGWTHQNRCVSATDFRGARFDRYLCLVVITGAFSPDPSASVKLSVELSRDAVEYGTVPTSSFRSKGGSRFLVPINLSGEKITVEQTFATRGRRGELTMATISCVR
jgi:hypothetical protein